MSKENPENFGDKGIFALIKTMLRTDKGGIVKKTEEQTEEGQFVKLSKEKTLTSDELAKLDKLKQKKFPDGKNN